MIIVQISDTHVDPEHENADARLRNLRACVDDINALSPAPDVVVHTGDMAHNGDETKYTLAARELERLSAPLLVCAGNRDDRALLPARFRSGRGLMPGTKFLQYAVDDFPIRLLVLDTISDDGNQGAYCEDRASNLSDALAADTDKSTVLFMHHPPFEILESTYPQQFNPWDDAARLASVLEGQRHVLRGFCGHSHRNAAGVVADIPFSTMPSVACDLRLGDFADDLADVPVYHIHRFEDGRFVSTESRAARAFAQDSAAD